jgi:hypothetical protein
VQTDSDASIVIDGNNLLYSGNIKTPTKYNPSIDLEPYSITKTDEGLYVVQIAIRLGDNGSLNTVPDHCWSPIQIEGNKEAFEKSQQRYLEVQKFWKVLAGKVEKYNQKHGFVKIDFTKSEFESFR